MITRLDSCETFLFENRIDGTLEEVKDKLKYTLGNETVILDIQEPVVNDSSDGVAIAIMSFQFKSGKKILALVIFPKGSVGTRKY